MSYSQNNSIFSLGTSLLQIWQKIIWGMNEVGTK